MEPILEQFLSRLLPDTIREHFQPICLLDLPHGIELRLEEYPELLPDAMSGMDNIVLDGFCNPLELLHYSLQDKPLYLKIYRRRWKQSSSSKHYSNKYDLHPSGVKATHQFASFLKEEVGCTAEQYLGNFFDIKS